MVEPNAIPIPKNAAMVDEAISFSRACTDLSKRNDTVECGNRWYFVLGTYFGAQIIAIFARYPLLNAKTLINMMKM